MGGTISVKDLDLFQYVDTPQEAFAILQKGLTEDHLESTFEHEQKVQDHSKGVPEEPAPSAQELLGPDIAKTR